MLVRASFARRNRYATQASLYLQRSSRFCFMLTLHGRFLQTILFGIQISSILESQFNVNRHFAFSREDARDSGNNAEIWQFYLIKSIFLN